MSRLCAGNSASYGPFLNASCLPISSFLSEETALAHSIHYSFLHISLPPCSHPAHRSLENLDVGYRRSSSLTVAGDKEAISRTRSSELEGTERVGATMPRIFTSGMEDEQSHRFIFVARCISYTRAPFETRVRRWGASMRPVHTSRYYHFA